ncbi:hypothetical protein OAN96_01500 [Candidatus Gracilibacteria bacterium]|nr:hypothetical protein [Candidatus Gracilibacteria bacterium]
MLELLAKIFGDVKLLYKNFIHWNISKLIYYIYGVLLAIVLFIPMLVLFIIVLIPSGIWGGFISGGFDIAAAVQAHPFIGLLSMFVFFTMLLVTYISLSFGQYLVYGLNFKYIKGKKPRYFSKKRYLDLSYIMKYARVGLLLTAVMILPYLVSLIIFIVIVASFGGPATLETYILANPVNAVTIGLFILLLVTVVFSLYLAFRLSFALLILADNKQLSSKALDYIKTSHSITSGWSRVLRFMGVFLVTAIATAPIHIAGDYMGGKIEDMQKYHDYLIFSDESGISYQGEFYKKRDFINKATGEIDTSYAILAIEYSDSGVPELRSKISSMSIYNAIYAVLYFLFIYGLFHMVFSSFYIRELKKNIKN